MGFAFADPYLGGSYNADVLTVTPYYQRQERWVQSLVSPSHHIGIPGSGGGFATSLKWVFFGLYQGLPGYDDFCGTKRGKRTGGGASGQTKVVTSKSKNDNSSRGQTSMGSVERVVPPMWWTVSAGTGRVIQGWAEGEDF